MTPEELQTEAFSPTPHMTKLAQQKAASEFLLLQTYNVTFPEVVDDTTHSETDEVTASIIEMFQPNLLTNYKPLSVAGDGNCCYRAVALAMFGTERHHEQLRLKAAIEILLNEKFYDSSNGQFVNLIGVNNHHYGPPSYAQMWFWAAKSGSYADMYHVAAISSVLHCPVRSYFPHLFQDGTFNRVITGRDVDLVSSPGCTVVWTMMSRIQSTKDFAPNHIVPLVPRAPAPVNVSVSSEDDAVENSSFRPVLNSTYVKPCARPDITKSPILSDSYSLIPEAHPDTSMLVESRTDSAAEHAEPVPSTELGLNNSGRFLDQLPAVKALLGNETPSFESIPNGTKNNTYFTIKQMHDDKGKNNYRDDCGSWSWQSSAVPKAIYTLLDDGSLQALVMDNSTYCLDRRRGGVRVKVPLDPQPLESSILIVTRYYTVLQADTSYKRRITAIHKLPIQFLNNLRDPHVVNLLLVEYIGQHPGGQAHGNTKISKNQNYQRTNPHVLATIDAQVRYFSE